ncbi:MAG: NAD(+) diphosphatase [Deltaproteobacteria bacterium]|jgi:NAD+ diphosphatase|nr:NAD(+) diphosphatase [Deltaproteobacteria bacterium]
MGQDSLWFMFDGALLLLREDDAGKRVLPRGEVPPLATNYLVQRVGEYRGVPCMAMALSASPLCKKAPGSGLAGAAAYTGLDLHYRAYELLGEELYSLATRARELAYWDVNSQFCPACGNRNLPDSAISKKCPACGKELFPPVSVAILVVVSRKNSLAPGGDEILLGRAHRAAGIFHSLLAGFLEAGETLEACVRREVLEETSLVVNNIRYFGSQPWPHPSNLMAGFFADYVSGEIKIQESELLSADFFRRDGLPPDLPHEFSLSRRLINWWVSGEALPYGNNNC